MDLVNLQVMVLPPSKVRHVAYMISAPYTSIHIQLTIALA